LMAEYPNLQGYFDAFRNGKAEQNEESLCALLGLKQDAVGRVVDNLVSAGFLERTGQSWKVPMLYREGLAITQGKAFDSTQTADDGE
jgi:DNA-binding IclR family transcriptional regulator